ncbi:putative protein S-acyltransferase [Helianthus anomalus]
MDIRRLRPYSIVHSVYVHDNLRQFYSFCVVSLSASSLLMFIRCSSKDPGYVKPSGGIRNNVDAEGPLVTIDLINSANWTGNWSHLCPTCKVVLKSFLYLIFIATCIPAMSAVNFC